MTRAQCALPVAGGAERGGGRAGWGGGRERGREGAKRPRGGRAREEVQETERGALLKEDDGLVPGVRAEVLARGLKLSGPGQRRLGGLGDGCARRGPEARKRDARGVASDPPPPPPEAPEELREATPKRWPAVAPAAPRPAQ